jgi:glyoxylase-like metal-dependent hydrolase (beta-lactamase superfamily II)
MFKTFLGDLQINLLQDGLWRLDAGTMFGIVPKTLWEKECAVDEKNRAALACNCPLIRTGNHVILLDCGLGRKWSPKELERYEIDPRPRLLEGLAALNVKPEDVTDIVLTHLHFDHVGGATHLNAAGEAEPVFVNACHWVERRELEAAMRVNELTRGTYLEKNIKPLLYAGLFEVFHEQQEIAPGVTVFRTGGHTAGHAAVRLVSNGKKALCPSEIMATAAHWRPAWVTAYDLFPLEMLELKKNLIVECLRDDVLLLLNHDPNNPAVRLKKGADGKIVVVPELERV